MKVYTKANIPWEKIYNINLKCGNIHDVKNFSVEILFALKELCDYDEGLIYFLDGNGKVYNQYLMNIDKQWSIMYLEYYSKIEEGRYSIKRKIGNEYDVPSVNIREWEREPASEFVANYIQPRGLKYSLGFSLDDVNGRPRTLFALDKIRFNNFTEDEFRSLSLIVPLLNNLHKKFYLEQTIFRGKDQMSWETRSLTPREKEITNLLCQGISPANISKILYISESTTHKHMANIYDKMHVSSIQELLVRLLRQNC